MRVRCTFTMVSLMVMLPLRLALAQVPDVVTLERDFSFPDGARDQRYAFHRITDISVADDGRILILDHARMGVRVYSPDGEHLGGFMREGRGPGEIRDPGGVGVAGDTAFVVDQWGRISAYRLDGTMLWDASLPFNSGDAAPLGADSLLVLPGNVQRASDRPRGDSPAPERVPFLLASDEGATTEVALTGFRGTIWWAPGEEGDPRWRPAAAYGGPEWVAAGDRGHAFLVNGFDGTIRRLRAGVDPASGPVVGRLGLTGRPFDRSMLLDSLLAWENAPKVTFGPGGRLIPRPAAEPVEGGRIVLPPADGGVSSVIPLSANTLLLEVKLSGLKILHWTTEWRLVDLEAGSSVRVEVPEGFDPVAGMGDRIVGVVKDALEVESVEVYAIRAR